MTFGKSCWRFRAGPFSALQLHMGSGTSRPLCAKSSAEPVSMTLWRSWHAPLPASMAAVSFDQQGCASSLLSLLALAYRYAVPPKVTCMQGLVSVLKHVHLLACNDVAQISKLRKKQAVWDWISEGAPVQRLPQTPAPGISVHAWASGQLAGVPSAAGRLVLSPTQLYKLRTVRCEAPPCKSFSWFQLWLSVTISCV